MEISKLIAFLLLEVLFVVTLYGAYLHFLRRNKPVTTDSGRQTEAAASDQYAALLQEAILQADARLASTGEAGGVAPEQQTVAETRLAFLRAERSAVDEAGADEERLWSLLSDRLAPMLPRGAAADDEGGSALVESLRLQLVACENRMANMEKFRALFFEMKSQLSDNNARSEQLHSEVRKAVPVEDQSPELKALMAELEAENQKMSAQLETVGNAFADILDKTPDSAEVTGDGIAGTVSDIEKDVERIRDVIAVQEKRISELAALIEEKDMALADKEALKQALEELGESNKELQSTIEVFEEENQFLQEQISMLLKQELEKTKSDEAQLEVLRKQTEEQQAAQAELSDKLAAMEKEYLQMYEENQVLKDGNS